VADTDESFSDVVNAAGEATLIFRCPQGKRQVVMKQVSHNGTIQGAIGVGTTAICTLFKNNYLISRTVAQGGTIAGDPPVTVRQSDVIALKYGACVVGAAVEMTVYYDDGT
jgi:hypothetical protein